jgi:MFS family permease
VTATSGRSTGSTASRAEALIVNVAGVVQGIALVTFPAASTVLTDPDDYDLSGLGCSALLPLTISFGQDELKTFAAGTAGGVIASYQLGYGIAAFGIGPLLDGGVDLSAIFGFSAVVAVCLGAWSFAVARRRPSPASLHPNLGHVVP